VVFEALPDHRNLLRRPPRPPDAPLFGPDTWRRARVEGGVMTLIALLIAG
jgi:Ca2+-transporting ATPase